MSACRCTSAAKKDALEFAVKTEPKFGLNSAEMERQVPRRAAFSSRRAWRSSSVMVPVAAPAKAACWWALARS